MIRPSSRFQGDAGLAARPPDLWRGSPSSSDLGSAGGAAAAAAVMLKSSRHRESNTRPFPHHLHFKLFSIILCAKLYKTPSSPSKGPYVIFQQIVAWLVQMTVITSSVDS